jgi:uncharacterized protein YegL
MKGPKLADLNFAIEEFIRQLQQLAELWTSCQIYMRVLCFSNGSHWHIKARTPLDQVRWSPVEAGGARDLGKAFDELSQLLQAFPPRSIAPVIVLCTDGSPTDDWGLGMIRLLKVPWARKAIKNGVAIGVDADMDVLKRFMASPEASPLRAGEWGDLLSMISEVATPQRRGGKEFLGQPLPPESTSGIEGIW